MRNKNLIIFGTGDIAELAYYYFTQDSEYQVAAFTVDEEYANESTFKNLPVYTFEQVDTELDPLHHELFIALSYSKLNRIRKEKYERGIAKGYSLASYISSKATVLNGAAFGNNCFILEDNTVQPFVQVGNNVTMWSGNHIGHHSIIHDHVFIASHAVISGGVEVGESSFIGVNATLRDHITVGPNCVVGAGVLLLEDAEENGIYKGIQTERSKHPAKKIRKI